ncbi:MAG: asparagine synthase-related protein, partial [Anaerolineae bacterium]
MTRCAHRFPDGQLFVLIGTPPADGFWPQVVKRLKGRPHFEDFKLPCEGRALLMSTSGDGREWTMWNDWCGSIPVFHAQIAKGQVASTLEPVVVAAAGYTPDDFFLPGLVSLLVNGHFLGNWTLYEGMDVVPPDCVAEWADEGFRWNRLWTVKPSEERWDRGWDELADEMFELSRQAIADVLKTQPSWILPLSGGLDSRLIAAVGAEMEVDLHAYTYGPPDWKDTIYARRVARALNLPWKQIDLGTRYLAEYTRSWADWFGSALHFHGMYQMPYLESLDSAPAGPIVQGFLGEALAGLHLPGLVSARRDGEHRGPLTDGWIHWSMEELKSLLKISIDEALERVATEMQAQLDAIPGAWFQRLMFLDFWNRQRRFVYYQSAMYDHWRGVATPFLNRDYARFCLSLPLLALEGRRLQAEMFRRYYRELAQIPGTYGALPLALSKRYIFKRGVAELLPKSLRRGPLREFNPRSETMDQDCVRASGQVALWPIYQACERLADWLEVSQVLAAHRAAAGGDLKAMRKLQA